MSDQGNQRPRWQQLRRWLRRAVLTLAAIVTAYGGFVLLGFVPVNRDYTAPPAADCVRIYVRSNEVHTDLVLPVVCDEADVDWRRLFPLKDFWGKVREPQFVAVGWGNREFYMNTPTWAQFKLSSACSALFWPSKAVLHVEYLGEVAPGKTMQPVLLTREQFSELAAFVEASVGVVQENGAAQIASEISYGNRDRFYVAGGRYHLFNTCNQWTGRGLKAAGAPTGIWTPLKPQVLYWLPTVED